MNICKVRAILRQVRVAAPALLMAALSLAVPVRAVAQTDGRFTGNVLDSTGAFVPGATVTVRNERTGEVRTVTTNAQGAYLVTNLKPSVYTIRATFGKFAPVEITTLTLTAAQEFNLDLSLQPAGLTETVTVQGTFSTVDLSSARMGVNVTEREVLNLPVNGRQMSQLLLQAPGSQNAGTGTWQDIRFSGRAVEQNVIRYDGIEGSAIIDSAPGNVNGENNTPFKLQASLENVQEFRVESNNYPAEYGTGTGGQVSVVTKSGSNAFHGALFEYFRSEKMDAPNYFDTQRANDGSAIADLGKSKLRQNQYGGSIGGPLARDKMFFFGSYEGYRLDAGLNFIEAVPSAAAWATATDPNILALRQGFLAPGAVVLAGASTNANSDIAQYQASQHVQEDAFSARLDLKFSQNWSSYFRVFRDSGENQEPQGVTGRTFRTTSKPTNLVGNLQTLMGTGTNDFKFGYNAAKSTEDGVPGIPALTGIAINLGGNVANSGIAGQGATTGLASPGGLVRVNSAGNGRSAPYDPYSLTIADTFNGLTGTHFVKVGGDVRLIRMTTDQQGGVTYAFPTQAAFLANQPSTIQYFGDLSESAPFHPGVTGVKRIKQEYYVAFAQDEWKVSPRLTLNYGLRYDYYTVLREADNRIVKFNIDTGAIDPDTTPLYRSRKNNFQPRLSTTYAATDKTVLRAGFGIFVGPGQTEDQIQPVEAERISTTLSGGALSFPMNLDTIRANFINNPNNRSYQPRAYANDYTLPERIYQYTASIQQELPGAATVTLAYVGSQGRNLFLRSVSNRTIGVLQTSPTANATNIREFDIVTCADGRVVDGRVTPLTSTTICSGSTALSKQSPFAEVDYKTSGGHDNYNALQIALQKRSVKGLALNGQYTLGSSKGNTGGSNEAVTAGNNARSLDEFDYDNGYNNFDVRHTFNASALYTLPGSGAWAGGWEIGGIFNGRSGLPVPVQIQRNDLAYVDVFGNVFNNPAADRVAVVNTPGGGSSRGTRRPDLVPGVDPFIKDGGLLYLNPAAFTTPAPGQFGNLERNSIHGPWFRQVDLVVSKRIALGGGRNVELRSEFFNIFNITNFTNPVGTLPNALPNASLTEANKVQPGQPYTTGAAGTFGRLTSTVGRTVGLGTPRQVQLAVRFQF